MRTFPLFCLAAFGLAPILHAQQPPQALVTPRPAAPPPPWLEKAPDFAQWTVTVKSDGPSILPKPGESPGATAAAEAGPRGEKPTPSLADYRIVVVKTKPLRCEQTVVGGGVRASVKWFLPDLQITTESGVAPVVAYTNSRNAAPDNSRTDFPGFEWISPRSYEGVQKVAGQDCLVFREPYKVDGRVVQSDPPLMSVACIGVDSKMPVALQAGQETRTYTFGQAPNAVLTLPPDVEALAAQWRNSVRQASHPVAKP